MVALTQAIVQAEEAQLAPEFEPGQRVLYHAPDGSVLDASVVELHASHWCAPRFAHLLDVIRCSMSVRSRPQIAIMPRPL